MEELDQETSAFANISMELAQKASNSPYTSPFFFIKKKDNKLHPVQDYRCLNQYTV